MNNMFVHPNSVNFVLLSTAFHLSVIAYSQLYLNLFKSVLSKIKNSLHIFITTSATALYLEKINQQQNKAIILLKQQQHTNTFDMVKMAYINKLVIFLQAKNIAITDLSNYANINTIFRNNTQSYLFTWNIAKEYALYNLQNSNITFLNNVDQRIKYDLQRNPKYICSNSGQIMQEPVYILDENNERIYFERLVLEELLSFSNIHPITKKQITINDIFMDFDLMNEIANKKILPANSIERPNNPDIDAVTIIDNPELTFDTADEVESKNPELTLQFNNYTVNALDEIPLQPTTLYKQINRANTAPPRF